MIETSIVDNMPQAAKDNIDKLITRVPEGFTPSCMLTIYAGLDKDGAFKVGTATLYSRVLSNIQITRIMRILRDVLDEDQQDVKNVYEQQAEKAKGY